MEFDEMKKIWDAQNNQPLYVMDEKALHNRIHSKMKTVLRATNISDWGVILIYLVTGRVLLGLSSFKADTNIFIFLAALSMFGMVVYLVVNHFRRIRASRHFDRSIQGDLDHAISLAGYQVRLSQIIRWSFLPVGAIMIFSGWEGGKLFQVGALILISYSVAFYVTSKGLRMNKRRKRELEGLKEKLEAGI